MSDTVVQIGTGRPGADLDRLAAAALAPVEPDAPVAAAAEMPEGWTLTEELY